MYRDDQFGPKNYVFITLETFENRSHLRIHASSAKPS